MDRHCSLLKAGRTTAIQQYYKQEGWKPRLAVALSLLLFGCYQWSNTAIFAADGLTKTEKEQETRKFGENLILEMIKANPKESAQPSNQTNQKIDSLAPSGSNQASKTPLGTPATTFTPAVSTPSPAIPASTMSSVTMPTMPNTVPADTGMQNISGDDRQWMKVTPESQSQRTPTAISPAGSLKTAKPGAENDRANEQSALVIPPLLNQNALTPNSASTEQIHNQTGAAVAPPVLKNQDNSTSLFPPSSGKKTARMPNHNQRNHLHSPSHKPLQEKPRIRNSSPVTQLVNPVITPLTMPTWLRNRPHRKLFCEDGSRNYKSNKERSFRFSRAAC